MMKKTHYVTDILHVVIECGIFVGLSWNETLNKRKVTCKNCRKTKAFRRRTK